MGRIDRLCFALSISYGSVIEPANALSNKDEVLSFTQQFLLNNLVHEFLPVLISLIIKVDEFNSFRFKNVISSSLKNSVSGL